MPPPYFWLSKATYSSDEYLHAIRQDPNAIQFVSNPTKEMIDLAIKGNPYVIQHIEQTPDNTLLAVTLDGMVLKFVRSKTHDICLAAIQSNPYAIQYVDPDFCSYDHLCRAAISIDPTSIDVIPYPGTALLVYACC